MLTNGPARPATKKQETQRRFGLGLAGNMFNSILRPSPYDIEVMDIDGCLTTAVAMARSADGNRLVSMVCELIETNICEVPCWEFSFTVDVVWLDGGGDDFRTQNRQMAAPYIPDDLRPKVMDVVCEALKCLVSHANCGMVYRVTKDVAPGEKALKKHDLLTEVLENTGYSVVDEGTDPLNRRFWLMKKSD